jgi:AcrR family transcriptional regulator
MVQIARAAGVSEATLYKYFDSKQALLSAVFTEWARPFVANLLDELHHIHGLRSQLALIGMSFLRGIQKTPRLHLIFFREIRWQNYQGSDLHKANHDFAQTIVAAVQRAIDHGEIRQGVDPTMVRDMLFGGLEHIAMRTLFTGRAIDIAMEVERYIDVIMHGVSMTTSASPEQKDLAERIETQINRLEELMTTKKC